jgi:hypothetical protein
MLTQLVAGGIKHMMSDYWERTLETGFLRLPHMPFFFADFALYLFSVENPTHEHDDMPSPSNPPSKTPQTWIHLYGESMYPLMNHQTWRWSWELLTQVPIGKRQTSTISDNAGRLTAIKTRQTLI